jgi:hypothetical protein
LFGPKTILKIDNIFGNIGYSENISKKYTSQNECSFQTNNSKWHFGQVEQGAKITKRNFFIDFFIKKS